MSAQPGTKKALPDVQIFISFWLSILDKIVKPSIVPRTLFAMFFQAQFSNLVVCCLADERPSIDMIPEMIPQQLLISWHNWFHCKG